MGYSFIKVIKQKTASDIGINYTIKSDRDTSGTLLAGKLRSEARGESGELQALPVQTLLHKRALPLRGTKVAADEFGAVKVRLEQLLRSFLDALNIHDGPRPSAFPLPSP